jgi:hypothetical protein
MFVWHLRKYFLGSKKAEGGTQCLSPKERFLLGTGQTHSSTHNSDLQLTMRLKVSLAMMPSATLEDQHFREPQNAYSNDAESVLSISDYIKSRIYLFLLLRYALGQGSPVLLRLVYRKTVPVGRVKSLYLSSRTIDIVIRKLQKKGKEWLGKCRPGGPLRPPGRG